jgi:hypothetical protein
VSERVEKLLEFVRANDRVCPLPDHWDQVWRLIKGNGFDRPAGGPGPPLILAGWWASDDGDKRARLAEHIRWAADHGALDVVEAHLRGLPEKQWHHERD